MSALREESQDQDIRRLGILGAGMMGAGIAYASAKAGIAVVLLDTTLDQAEKGKGYSGSALARELEAGRIEASQRKVILDRIETTTDFGDLAGCNLIIEAVFEDPAVKADVTGKAEAVISEKAVYASNTSTLPISGLAEASIRPRNFIGLHFFSPVDRMPLVEIIKGARTSTETLGRCKHYVRQIGKTPIVVNDSRGFYTSRVFGTYTMEGAALLLEGQDPGVIETVGVEIGMPMGPLAILDQISLSLCLQLIEQTRRGLAAEGRPAPELPGVAAIERMVRELDRPGRKAGRGFYDYPPGQRKSLWNGLGQHFVMQAPIARRDIADRLIFPQANEAARCYEEGIVERVADANTGSMLGWGFPPRYGGALEFINRYGVARFVGRACQLAGQYGPRFEPAQILLQLAAEGSELRDDART
ncbi:MAG: 3-hydroxyacyl-CoA dehydrogenase NAD-binding domain-containing protein [Steroidobacteraceae bacterium]